jgi:AcrR family transcriptional regulator
MGIAERREREREDVRKKILDAARELFATEGYERVTMRRIADAIEYSPTTIYLHFKDKDELVQSLCQDDFLHLLAELGSGPMPKDPVDRIRQLGIGYARFGTTYPNHYRFMFMTPFKPEHEPSEAGERAYSLVREAAAEAIAAGALRKGDVETTAQVLWATVHGAVSLLVAYGEKFPCAPAAPDLVEQVIENGLRGLLAGAPDAPRRPKLAAVPRKKGR